MDDLRATVRGTRADRRRVLVGSVAAAAMAGFGRLPGGAGFPAAGGRSAAAEEGDAAPRLHGYLFTSTNNIAEDENAVVGFGAWSDGSLRMLAQGPVPTGGTGTNNGFVEGVAKGNAKLGPMDNDTPVAATPDGAYLYTVNGGSDTVAGFAVGGDGSLTSLPGSPFPSGGTNPNSVAVSPDGKHLAVANRNEDPLRQDLIRSGKPNVAVFEIGANGGLTAAIDPVAIEPVTYGLGGQTMPTQVYWSPVVEGLLFVNNFRVDALWTELNKEPDKDYSQQWSEKPEVSGNIQWVKLAADDTVATGHVDLPDVPPAAEAGAPSIPLNVWGHPTEKVLYVNMVTRNALGVLTYDDTGALTFVDSVPSSGRDVCWARVNAAGTRLYQIANAANADEADPGSSIEVFDISGDKATKPEEIQRVSIPAYGSKPFVNDRGQTQTGTAFIPTLNADDTAFFFGMQRANQTPENADPRGNYIVCYDVLEDGMLAEGPSLALDLHAVGFPSDSRPWGLVYIPA